MACGMKWRRLPNGTLAYDVDGELQPRRLPDYLNDLNAMHEAEKILDGDIYDGGSLRYSYARELYKLCPPEEQPLRATAENRAEAFLKTLNLWVP